MNRTTALVATILLALLSLTVGAQVYRWVDKDGKVQYSDQPPPPGAGKSDALRINSASPSASSAKAADKAADKGKPADKGKTTDAEKAKSAADEARVAKQVEENCRDARAQVRTLQDGGRISTTNEQGERVFMNEDQMAAEIARLQKLIAENCK